MNLIMVYGDNTNSGTALKFTSLIWTVKPELILLLFMILSVLSHVYTLQTLG